MTDEKKNCSHRKIHGNTEYSRIEASSFFGIT